MKKIVLLLSFIFLLVLSSCSKILDQDDKDILLESINNFDNSEVRNYAYKDSNNNLNTIRVSFFDDYYSFSLNGNRYKYNPTLPLNLIYNRNFLGNLYILYIIAFFYCHNLCLVV